MTRTSNSGSAFRSKAAFVFFLLAESLQRSSYIYTVGVVRVLSEYHTQLGKNEFLRNVRSHSCRAYFFHVLYPRRWNLLIMLLKVFRRVLRPWGRAGGCAFFHFFFQVIVSMALLESSRGCVLRQRYAVFWRK